jgi:hypothetical protein
MACVKVLFVNRIACYYIRFIIIEVSAVYFIRRVLVVAGACFYQVAGYKFQPVPLRGGIAGQSKTRK